LQICCHAGVQHAIPLTHQDIHKEAAATHCSLLRELMDDNGGDDMRPPAIRQETWRMHKRAKNRHTVNPPKGVADKM
jgi:hypothetical protein